MRPPRPVQPLLMAAFGVGLLIVGALSLGLLPKSGEAARTYAAPVPVSYPAPALALTDLSGAPVALVDFRDRVVLVNNWATWCPPCKAEMPTLQAYYEQHRDEGFTMIAIEAGEPPDQVAAYVRQNGLTFPVWPDPDETALKAFRNQALPSSYVIDRTGTVRLTWTGEISLQNLEQSVTPLLRGGGIN